MSELTGKAAAVLGAGLVEAGGVAFVFLRSVGPQEQVLTVGNSFPEDGPSG